MSYTTDLTLCLGYEGDEGLAPFLEKLAAVERFNYMLHRMDTSDAGGTRHYGSAVYAVGSNHFPTQELQALIDSVRWRCPDRVVLLACSERFETLVVRPAYEYEERWGDYARAYQPAFEPAEGGTP
jgi:hypothetical protein